MENPYKGEEKFITTVCTDREAYGGQDLIKAYQIAILKILQYHNIGTTKYLSTEDGYFNKVNCCRLFGKSMLYHN